MAKTCLREVTTLEALFELWKDAHATEEPESCEKTFPRSRKGDVPKGKFKTSFCRDGYLTGQESLERPMLFVLKESNAIGKEKEGEFCGKFWLQENVHKAIFAGALNEKEPKWVKLDKNAWRYINWVRRHYQKWAGTDDPSKHVNPFCNPIAFMNLNKRGGYGSTDSERLKNYVEEYKDYLKKQIEIVNPRLIICGGIGTDEIVKSLFDGDDSIIIARYHPAARRREKD